MNNKDSWVTPCRGMPGWKPPHMKMLFKKFKKLLCFFGLHLWEWEYFTKGDEYDRVYCLRCGKTREERC